MTSDEYRQATKTVHTGHTPDPATRARAPPIYQTTSYVFDDADTAADLYALTKEGEIYSRISNPTVRVLEDRLAALESGTDAVATTTGMAAFDAITTTLASTGDTIVSASDIYGGTTAYLTYTAKRRGITPRFVDTLDYGAYREAIDDTTAFLHAETIGNPSLLTPDIERLAAIAHDADIPLVIDNTFATPILCRPLEHGADIVWESTTKWIHGAGTTLGGILIDGGSFDWSDYSEIGQPNPAFHGITFADEFKDRAFAVTARHRALRPIGAAQSPFDAWQTIQGLETLHLRMERHCTNAEQVARFLDDHEAVEWVTYPGLESHPTHQQATKYLNGGYGGMIAFGPTGGYDAARRLCERVELASFLANIGDAKTLVIHPASTTHAQLTADEQAASGVTPDMIRLSVGIEDAEDIIADLDQALTQPTPG